MQKHLYNSDHSVITFATNKQSYLELALNCARSILLHNDISIYIVSNLNSPIPDTLKNNVFILPPLPGHAEMGIGMKLHIDQYLQTTHSLFIDSDCLVYGSLNSIFEAAMGNDVSVAGNITAAKNWCGHEQAETIKQNFGVDDLIRYNGGLYYLKRSDTTTKIFDKARAIGQKYDDYGFDRIGKWINEEAPISIAMMLDHQKPIADDGQFMTDLFTDGRPNVLNVLTGDIKLENPAPPAPRHRPWYPAVYSPVILHFGGSSIKTYPYNAQVMLLKLNELQLPIWLSSLFVTIFYDIPYKSYYRLRK